jgi:muramidase (phage lysozyme)
VAISSPLNPSTIARERSTTAEAAQNFITGGSPLGEGVVASAANKIVGFQRGAAGVAARPPDLQGIIQTLSTSILNNVENRVQSINQNVTQIVNKSIGGLEQDYKDRLGKIDAAKPSSILQNFLNLYKEALGYIQFLGNRKNIRTLGDNLKSLQNVFTETFNIAKLIRQTIIKIVKQLSNLPAATGGGAGINLDLDIPGGSLRRGPLSGIGRMIRRRPGMVLGGAALAGGLGTQVVSGMMDIGGDVQAAPMSEGTIPTSLLDRFNSILDRFSVSINAFASRKPPSPSSKQSGTAPPPKDDKKTPPPMGPGPGSGVSQDVSQAIEDPNVKAFLDVLAKPESGGRYDISVGGKTFKDMSKHPEMYNAELNSDAAGRYQFLSTTYNPIARRLGLKDFSPQSQDLAAVQYLKDLGVLDEIQSGDPKKIEDAKRRLQKSTWTGLRKYGEGQASKYFLERKSYYSKNITNKQQLTQNINNLTTTQPGQTPIKSELKPTSPKVTPAPTPAATQQQIAQTVSQPPVQQTSQITVAPMNMASPQTQSTKVGDNAIPPPAMSKGGISVPFLSSSNNDNFLTLYSRIVYNIVDG